MSEEMFGPEPSSSDSWGGEMAPGDPGGESMPSGMQDLGGGLYIRVPDAVIRQLLRSPEAMGAIKQRAQAVVDAANGSHITEGAVYESRLVDNPEYRRPVVFVKPANFKAVIDEQYHSTLLAAAAQVGSDPYLEPGAPMGGSSGEMAVE